MRLVDAGGRKRRDIRVGKRRQSVLKFEDLVESLPVGFVSLLSYSKCIHEKPSPCASKHGSTSLEIARGPHSKLKDINTSCARLFLCRYNPFEDVIKVLDIALLQ